MSERLEVPEDEVERRKPSAVFRDPRIDRLVTWGIGLVPAVGIAFVMSFTRGLDTKFTAMEASQSKVSADLLSFKSELNDKLFSLRQDISSLADGRVQAQLQVAEIKATLLRYEERIRELEKGSKK